jgi:hypothetical protein
MTRREKISAIEHQWQKLLIAHDEVGNLINGLRPAMEEMKLVLEQEDLRLNRELISELVARSVGREWRGFACRPDAGKELLHQIGDSKQSGQVEILSVAEQRYPVFLFLGEEGKALFRQYKNGSVLEDDVTIFTQSSLA